MWKKPGGDRSLGCGSPAEARSACTSRSMHRLWPTSIRSMATASYLDAVAGGMVAGAAFDDDDAAVQAVTLLRESGVREQDITVLAADPERAALIAGDRARIPFKTWRGLRVLLAKILAKVLPGRDLPHEVRERYGHALRAGQVVVVAAAGGQPPDTIA